ncbi:MAG TPA: ROK family transcriptional regulator [Mycobacterium sp.]|nr:ROK family transcriptional regulator [Mycobacterium sp.]
MNEKLLLGHIRDSALVSRAELARLTGLSKPTVSLALTSLEQAGLVQASGVRTGTPGPNPVLYEVRPDAGYVLALDVGREYVRGAVSDVAGTVRARESLHLRATTRRGRVAGLTRLAGRLCDKVGLAVDDMVQTVLGSPGVYDPGRDALSLAGALEGWGEPQLLSDLRSALGDSLMIENDVDAAALAEQAHGHGRGVQDFAFVSIGTGIGMGLVLDGRLRRGVKGAAGEIAYLPLQTEIADQDDVSRRGGLEASASAAGIVEAARRCGMTRVSSARQVFDAARRGDKRAERVVAAETVLIARALCSVIAVVDPQMVVLGGGIGKAEGLVEAVRAELAALWPVPIDVRVSALGVDAVVDGCLASGVSRAWELITNTDRR